MHGRSFVRNFVHIFQLLANIVGVEDRVFGGQAQAIVAVGHDVGERAHVHAEVAVEHANAADGLGAVIVESQAAIRLGDDDRYGQERL